MKKIVSLFFFLSLGRTLLSAQTIQLPSHVPAAHPRLLTHDADKAALRKRIDTEAWAKKLYETTKASIDPYVVRHQTDPQWIVSRLQMYWQSKSTDVFFSGGTYVYATGQAPVPTVRFAGTRDATTPYLRPKLEDIQPYMDAKGLYLQNGALPGKPWEWVETAKSGRIVEAINRDLMGMAHKAAFVYWYSGDSTYARFAFDLFDTYMTGMQYRKEPVDLSHSHAQTLVGLTSFEVIHENVLDELVPCYDFLHGYLKSRAAQKMPEYTNTFRKWADLIIRNGVPFNNWDLFEARFVAEIALILEDDKTYPDGRGCQYYLDQIFNKTVTRQWSLVELIRKGYDQNTGIWGECAGYAQGVISDFTEFVSMFGRVLNVDLIPQLPIIPKAVLAMSQYQFPNGMVVGFGDTHYGLLTTAPIQSLIENAQRFNKPEQEAVYTRLLKQLTGSANHVVSTNRGPAFAALFDEKFTLDKETPAGTMADFVTPLFYAPNVSWLAQRNGLDPQTGLMISQAGSLGNHAHANGIAMELYGKGIVLAPEGGIGTSYFQPDYAQYYSQFPAHNTVVVDGISAYPTMRSSHGFSVQSCYPASAQKAGYFPTLTYSDLYFLEPETNAGQNRVMSIIRTGDKTGYYVDIFRSRRKDDHDKWHDYFYHNLGQELTLTDKTGVALPLQPSEHLSFADGDLIAYDFLWDKKSSYTSQDVQATFSLRVPGRETVQMAMWLKGAPGWEIFSVKSPPTKSFRRNVMIPNSIAGLPLPAVVVRQTGEAWKRPFVAVYEPSTASEPRAIRAISSFTPAGVSADFVGLLVDDKAGSREFIFSATGTKSTVYQGATVQASYAVISESGSAIRYLFMGNGQQISKGGWQIVAKSATSAALSVQNGTVFFTADGPVTVTIPEPYTHGKGKILAGNNVVIGTKGKTGTTFSLPALPFGPIELR